MKRIHHLMLLTVGAGLLLAVLINTLVADELSPLSESSSLTAVLEQTASPDTSPAQDNAPSVPPTAAAGAAGRSAWTPWLLWSLGAVEFWLAGSLGVCAVLLWLSPLRLQSLDERLKKRTIPGIRLSGGMPLTLSHLTLVRAFADHPRVLDAWIARNETALCEWNSIALDETEEPIPEASLNGLAFDLNSSKELRERLPSAAFCLCLCGDQRRQENLALTALLRKSLHPQADQRLTLMRLIPVVLDPHCHDRLKKTEPESSGAMAAIPLMLAELRRIDGLAADLLGDWSRKLVLSQRLLPIVEDWRRTPASVREALLTAYSRGELSRLIILGGDSRVPDVTGIVRVTLHAEGTATIELPPATTSNRQSHPAGSTIAASPDSVWDLAAGLAAELNPVQSHVTETAAVEPEPINEPEPVATATAPELRIVSEPVEEESAEEPAVVPLPVSRLVEAQSAPAPVSPAAVEAIGRIGRAMQAAVPRLDEALSCPDETIRQRAAQELSNVFLKALPVLYRAAEDQQPEIRETAEVVLAQLNGFQAVIQRKAS